MFYNNLKAICDKQGLKITPIVLECGGNKGSLSGWKNGAMPNSDIVMKLAVRLNVPTDCLLFGENYNSLSLSESEKKLIKCFSSLNDFDKCKIIERAETLAELAAERAAQEAEKISKEKKKTAEKSKPIIVAPAADEAPEQDEERLIEIRHSVYKVSAGCGFELDEGDNWETIEISDTPEARRADYALTISGDSMEPVYYDGDIVLVKMQDTVEMGQIGIFILDGSGYIKKYCGDHLVSLNEDYDDIPLSDYEDVRCSGRVIGRV